MISNLWDKKPKGVSLKGKILDRVKHDAPLSKRIDETRKQMNIPISHLRTIGEKLQARDDYLFRKIVAAQHANNTAYAKMYANELLQVRTMKNMVRNAKLSMEQIQLRLNTVSDMGDIVVTLSPCMSIIRDLGPAVSTMMPTAANSLQDLSGLMNDLMCQSSMGSDDMMSIDTPRNQEAMSILDEANSVISKETQAFIPKIPDNLAQSVDDSSTNNTSDILPRIPPNLARRTSREMA